MKLRYIYLLCFLLSIDWSFCFEYISGDRALRPHHSIKKPAKSKHGKPKAQHRRIRRQGYEEEKDPVASIDVANFIQQPDPDYQAIEDPTQFKNRHEDPKYDDDIEFLNNIEMSLEKKNQNLQNSLDDFEDSNIQSGQESANTGKLVNNEFSVNTKRQSSYPETKAGEKSSRRHAIPFFSHKNKHKKEKKRKLFHFGTKRTSSTTSMPSLMPKGEILKPDSILTKAKRSTFQRFCPLCKRKLMKTSNKEEEEEQALTDIIHNSRQYFKKIQKREVPDYDDYNNRPKERENRETGEDAKQEYENDNLLAFPQRQLKELDAIQKRVDALQISFPQGLKNTPENSHNQKQ